MKACERCGVVRIPVFVERTVCRKCEPPGRLVPLSWSVVRTPADVASLARRRTVVDDEYGAQLAARAAAMERLG